jgi:membrane protein
VLGSASQSDLLKVLQMGPSQAIRASSWPSRWQRTRKIILETVSNWDKDNVSRLAAALSCYAILATAPLGILSVAIAGAVFGEAAVRGQIATEIGSIVGAETARAIETIIRNARSPGAGVWSTVFGVVVLLFGASGVFVELRSAMNEIWKVNSKEERVVTAFVRNRAVSFVMVLAVSTLLLVSLLLSAALTVVESCFEGYLPGTQLVWQVANALGSLVLTTAIFAVVFRLLPDISVPWKEVWPGAFLTGLLFAFGKLLLGIYIGHSSVASSFGVTGSIVAVVIWVYYSSQIVFVGAEFTVAYSHRNRPRTP